MSQYFWHIQCRILYACEKILFSESCFNEKSIILEQRSIAVLIEGTVCAIDLELLTVGLLKVKATPADIRTSSHFKLVNKSDVIFHMLINLACRDRKLTEL